MLWLLIVSFGVGILIGAVGIGGILLIPALSAFAGLGIHSAMATALFTFIFTGIAGTALFQRRGSIHWGITVPVCAGAVAFGFVGAWANSRTHAPVLSLLLAGLIIFAGLYTLFSRGGIRRAALDGRPGPQRALLAGIGAFSGFGSGLTGVGGPALSVPIMVLFGFPPLVTIGTSQVIQILAAISGTVGNLKYGSIDFALAGLVTLFEVVGVLFGVRIVHAVDARKLRRVVALLCIAVGIGLTARALG
ncbi:MAG: sulfite exporter TauE/SafE family protein [Betaproteobacteria bacterium]|nr:sulfite exporter TauE/SafE family protein [Betaproteobacteria bacterium]